MEPAAATAAGAAGLATAVALLALLGLEVGLAPRLPDLGHGAAPVALYAAVPLALCGLALWALHPLAAHSAWRALALFALAGAAAVVLALADVEALATPLKLAAAAGLGFWLAGLVEAAWQLAVLAGAAALVDIASVAAGPTNELVDHAPRALDIVALHLPAWGGGPEVLIGATDFVFMAAFLAGAIAFGLRARATLAAMVAALVVTVAASVAAGRGLPGLPLMAAALLAVNWDRIFRASSAA